MQITTVEFIFSRSFSSSAASSVDSRLMAKSQIWKGSLFSCVFQWFNKLTGAIADSLASDDGLANNFMLTAIKHYYLDRNQFQLMLNKQQVNNNTTDGQLGDKAFTMYSQCQ